MNTWKSYIDNIIENCCLFMTEKSTFESVKDPVIATLLYRRLLAQEQLREDIVELIHDYIRKYYGSTEFTIEESNIDLEVMHSLSRRLMVGFHTYQQYSQLDQEFRKHINHMVCWASFQIFKD